MLVCARVCRLIQPWTDGARLLCSNGSSLRALRNVPKNGHEKIKRTADVALTPDTKDNYTLSRVIAAKISLYWGKPRLKQRAPASGVNNLERGVLGIYRLRFSNVIQRTECVLW